MSVSPWAFPLMLCGTISLCLGMFLCAYIIEQVAGETYYGKRPIGATPDARDDRDGDIYWVQMGNQKVGDQVFSAFIGKHPSSHEYLRSRKKEHTFHNHNSAKGSLLQLAVTATMLGFVIQFIGLRYLHPAIALTQLAVTVLMAFIRAFLRTQRLSSHSNLVIPNARKRINGHELDYLAFAMEAPDYPKLLKDHEEFKILVHLQFSEPKGDDHGPIGGLSNRATNIFKIRTRLAKFTSNPAPAASWGSFEVRCSAVKLKQAIEGVLKVLFDSSDSKPKLRWGWKDRRDFTWPLKVSRNDKEYDSPCQKGRESPPEASIDVEITRESMSRGYWAPCKVRVEELEALIGLWSWSFRHHGGGSYRVLAYSENDIAQKRSRAELANWIQLEVGSILPSPDHTFMAGVARYGFQQTTKANFPLFVSTTETHIGLCAQDLFVAFLKYVSVNIIAEIGGRTTFRSKPKKTEYWKDFQLVNTQVDLIVKIF